MTHIVLTEDQVHVVRTAGAIVEVRDTQGRTIAHLTPLDAADVEAIERWKHRKPSEKPLIPSAQVQAHLRRLEEIRQEEGMDETKMLALLRRMQAGEEV
jgi:hypothetical protein